MIIIKFNEKQQNKQLCKIVALQSVIKFYHSLISNSSLKRSFIFKKTSNYSRITIYYSTLETRIGMNLPNLVEKDKLQLRVVEEKKTFRIQIYYNKQINFKRRTRSRNRRTKRKEYYLINLARKVWFQSITEIIVYKLFY